MYILSCDVTYLRAAPRVTRGARKVVFKVPAKILPIYERSPYYQGTKLWNELEKETQKKDNIFSFKKEIDKLYMRYKPI